MTDYVWTPNAQWIANANVRGLMQRAGFDVSPDDPVATAASARAFVRWTQAQLEPFWDAALRDMDVTWDTPYTRVLDRSRGNAWADWFVDGRLNIVRNCIDRHAASALADKTALIAETEDGQVRRYTFAQLDREVCKLASALRAMDVREGDRVASYMPMIAEVVIAMLAVQKIGAVFVPIFSGYAPPAVRERLQDAEVKVVVTADAALRRGARFALKPQADAAVDGLACVQHVLVVQRFADDVACSMRQGRDVFWHDALAGQPDAAPTASMAAMAPALMLYTSGTTGKPKGTVHTHAGCLAQMGKELFYNFDLKLSDVFWWFSDIGWMMGPWEIIGCFMHGGTLVIFEGAPNYPEPDRVWRMVQQHGVTTLGISPTAVRLLMRAGDDWVQRHPMPSLRMLGSTGEPWDPQSYRWYFEHVGRGRCPVINISGGTDIVGCFLAPLPIMPLKAASLQSPGLGMDVDVFDEQGQSIVDEVGYLVCKQPCPSMTRGLWKANDKYLQTYWSQFPDVWSHGDWAKVDRDGDWFVLGRADDTMKIAGRRVGPGEIEAALIEDPAVSEAAAVGVPDDLKGTDVVCFVVPHAGVREDDALRARLVQRVVDALGKVDRPRAVYFVDDLPKTRSAKILRRLIRQRHLRETGPSDLSSLANPEALDAIGRAR